MSSAALQAHSGKQSVSLDIATVEGQRIIRELAKQCDVLLENYKLGNLARYGLTYEDLRPLNVDVSPMLPAREQ